MNASGAKEFGSYRRVSPENQGRNSLWMSKTLRKNISRCHLLIVGCGGLGSLLVVKAAHLGFRDFTLVDSDRLETSNLNRFIIAAPKDVGRPKSALLYAYLTERFPDVRCQTILESFPNQSSHLKISPRLVCIGCLDDVKPRIELDIFARAAQVTLIDFGCGFVVEETGSGEKNIVNAGGQIIFSRPHGPCLNCLGFALDTTRNTYYVTGNQIDPSSLLLNGVIVSLGLEALLKELANELGEINRVDYDRKSLTVYRSASKGKPTCAICGINSRAHIRKVAKPTWLYNKLKKECRIV